MIPNSPFADLQASGETLTPRTLLRLIGGWLGLAESVLPPTLFSVTYAVTKTGIWSVLAAATSAMVFLVVRIIRRQQVSGALIGIAGVFLAAFLALREGGQTLDYFVPGFFTNAGYAAVLLVSLVIRRPLFSYLLAFLTGETNSKLTSRARRIAWILTVLWTSFFALRLLVQVPLYFAENLELLAASRAVLGAPAYAGLLALTWLIIRPLMTKSNAN